MKVAPFGKYLLLDKLGRGHTTDVYLAVPADAKIPDDLLVIRRLRSSQTHPDELRSQDVAVPPRAELACMLHHPCIATTYEVSVAEEGPYWARQYVRGQSLDTVLSVSKRNGGFPVSLGLRLVLDVLRALHYAHSLQDEAGEPRGVFHRDVRPRKIFVSYSGEVKLLDFGAARRERARTTDAAEDSNPYAAPEQVDISDDARVDIYAVGRLLDDVLAHRGPLRGLEATTWSGMQLAATLPVAAHKVLPLGPLQSIAQRATAHDLESRFPTAQAMLTELEALVVPLAAADTADSAHARDALGAYMQRTFRNEQDENAARLALLLAALAQPEAAAATAHRAPPLAWWEQDDSIRSRASVAVSTAARLDADVANAAAANMGASEDATPVQVERRPDVRDQNDISSSPPPLPRSTANTPGVSISGPSAQPPASLATSTLPLPWWEVDDRVARSRNSVAASTAVEIADPERAERTPTRA